MSDLRENPRTEFCGEEVSNVKDYSAGTDGLPKSDVLIFVGKSFSVVVRPSGTEPKIKFYITAKGSSREESENLSFRLLNYIKTIV